MLHQLRQKSHGTAAATAPERHRDDAGRGEAEAADVESLDVHTAACVRAGHHLCSFLKVHHVFGMELGARLEDDPIILRGPAVVHLLSSRLSRERQAQYHRSAALAVAHGRPGARRSVNAVPINCAVGYRRTSRLPPPP